MKRAAVSLLVALVIAGRMSVPEAGAQGGTPPEIDVAIALGDTLHPDGTMTLDDSVFLVGEPMYVTVTLRNNGGDVIVPKGFKERDFHLDLVFTGPGGEEIRTHASELDGQHTPPPPRVYYVLGQPLQVEPVEIVESSWVGGSEPALVQDWYDLPSLGPHSVRAEISTRTYPEVTQYISTEPYAELDSVNWAGKLASASESFLIAIDSDGDGVLAPADDCDDGDPAIPGAAEIPYNGKDDDCNPLTLDQPGVTPGYLSVRADLHVIQVGSYPVSTKHPMSGLEVRVFDTGPGSCIDTRGYGYSWHYYRTIWLSCQVPNEQIGLTDASGTVTFSLEPKGYFIIAEHREAGSEEPVYMGVNAGAIESGVLTEKYLQLLEKSNGKVVPGKYTEKTGSLLLVIEPAYVEWDGTEELYPFVFDSIGDWTVTTSVAPPEGFVADHDALSEDVNSELEAVQFVITDIGSEWVSTGVLHEIKHKGKKEKIKSKVDVKLSKKLAKEKGLTRLGKKLKK